MSLSALLLTYPAIDPVLFELGPLAIRWYSLAYIVGVVLGWWYVARLNDRTSSAGGARVLTDKILEDLVVWAVLGVILGGRLGYVLFYQLDYYLANPLEILQIWHGGMSFHGGLLGVLASLGIYCRRQRLRYLQVMDLVAPAVPIGLGLGRIANFINGELYGREGDVPWAMVFPGAGEVARHPSQLYEAGLEGLVLFIVLHWVVTRTPALKYTGRISGLFLVGYAVARGISEFFREPDAYLGYFSFGTTMGQLLCLPMLLVGIVLMWRSKKVSKGKVR